jgi:hypothetical protein
MEVTGMLYGAKLLQLVEFFHRRGARFERHRRRNQGTN